MRAGNLLRKVGIDIELRFLRELGEPFVDTNRSNSAPSRWR